MTPKEKEKIEKFSEKTGEVMPKGTVCRGSNYNCSQ